LKKDFSYEGELLRWNRILIKWNLQRSTAKFFSVMCTRTATRDTSIRCYLGRWSWI